MKTEYRPYLCEYQHDGSLWSITVQATSFEDAKARLQQMYYGRVLGTLEATIPAVAGAGCFVRALCWLRNAIKPETAAPSGGAR